MKQKNEKIKKYEPNAHGHKHFFRLPIIKSTNEQFLFLAFRFSFCVRLARIILFLHFQFKFIPNRMREQNKNFNFVISIFQKNKK